MADKAVRSHRVQGELELAGILTPKEIQGERSAVTGKIVHTDVTNAPMVYHAHSATISHGAFVVRTDSGSSMHGQTHTDQYVYIPFRSGTTHNACVMKIEKIVLVCRENMGWPNNEARLAVGEIWDHLRIGNGAALETMFNDDPVYGSCCVPRVLLRTPSKRKAGYKYVVHLRQIHCPCVYIPDKAGDMFITLSKMGFHGRTDMLFEAGVAEPDAVGGSSRDDARTDTVL